MATFRYFPESGTARKPTAVYYVLAVLLAGASALAAFYLGSYIAPTYFPLFLIAVLVSAWYGGWGPALVTTCLGGLAVVYFLFPPAFSLTLSGDDFFRLGFYFITACIIAGISIAKRRADRNLRNQNQELRRKDEQVARLAAIVESSEDAIIGKDLTGIITAWNHGAERLYGYTSHEAIGQPVAILYPPEHLGDLPDTLEQLKQKKPIGQYETTHIGKNRNRISVAITISPIIDSTGEVVGGAVISRDITERKQIQRRLENLNDELEIKVRDRTALAEARSQKLREVASALTVAEQRERRRLAQILHDHLQQMLVAAKLSVSRLNQAHDPLSLKETVEDVQSFLDEAVSASRSLTVELSPPILRDAGIVSAFQWLARWMKEKHGLHVLIHESPDIRNPSEDIKIFLFQAVRELLFNVVKHADTNEASVTIRSYGGKIYTEVKDNGKGFDDTQINLDTESGAFGLRSIRERLEMLNCEMSVESAVGKGTSIHITVPIAEAPPARKSHVRDSGITEDIVIPSVGDRKIRVLVVDDHRILRQGIIKHFQNRQDIEVAGEAADGEEAVQKIRELLPDVVIMDISMPKLNGVDATRLIKAQFPSVRIISLSLHESEDMQKTMFEAGAAAYLSKSGPIDNLIQTVHEVCSS